jgi:iron complex outermembrane receptor protein
MPAKGFGGNEVRCRCFINIKTYIMKQVCTLLVLASISCYAHAQISLRGTVTGPDNLRLIGAHVTLNNNYNQTTTNELGEYSFSGIKSGIYRFRVSYVGYLPVDRILVIRKDSVADVRLIESATISEAVIVSAVRASQNTPTTFSTISKEDIARKNSAQDLPYLLNHEPSVVTTSDAGAGVGYTGLRIRGSDITRINVTINGIPLNDPESHAVYWVDIPDFAGSVNSLQIQRGVGSSTNGAGAFGASMNIETNTFQSEPFSLISLAAGSFNTWKTSFQAGTGLIKDHWYFEGRGSVLGSDGYIDRASSDLSSFFVQGGYYDDKTLVKAIVFGGHEKTYQAWYGIDEYTMERDRTLNYAGAIYHDNDSVSHYDNQSDNYTQNHYQLHISHRLSGNWSFNLSGHYTTGRGYYEEYQQADSLKYYGLHDLYFGEDSLFNGTGYEHFYHDTVSTSDIIRRRWLDNKYYGMTWSLHHRKEKLDLIIGGSFNKFDKAKHFGEIIWAEYALESPKDYEYYNNVSFKTDLNVFAKAAWSPVEALTFYGDLQLRTINYHGSGIESHLEPVAINESFRFFNPKAGLSYNLKLGTIYASYAIAHREPIRDDYTDAIAGEEPEPETLGNLELGIRKSENLYRYTVNYFLMNFRNQLVLTGEINDDGAYVRRNAGKSYRTGVEISGGYKPFRLLSLFGNLSLSVNKTDYKQNAGGLIVSYKNTPLSFSPSVTGSLQMQLFPVKNLEIDWSAKYVSRQYLDNTGNNSLALDPYLINDARIAYFIASGKMPDIEVTLMISNIFNTLYESNGYVYGDSPYYYPQAGIHFMAGLAVRL